jgi:hypothetical protein
VLIFSQCARNSSIADKQDRDRSDLTRPLHRATILSMGSTDKQRGRVVKAAKRGPARRKRAAQPAKDASSAKLRFEDLPTLWQVIFVAVLLIAIPLALFLGSIFDEWISGLLSGIGKAFFLLDLALVAVGGAVVVFLRIRHGRGYLLHRVPIGIEDPLTEAAIGLGYVAVGFVMVTAILIYHHWGVTATGVSGSEAHLARATLETDAWSVVKVIPVLELPEALGWHPALQFTNTLGRILNLLFKLMFILPLVVLVQKPVSRILWRATADW